MLVDAVKAYIDTKKTKLPEEDTSTVNDEFVAAYGANAAVPLPEHTTPTPVTATESFPTAEPNQVSPQPREVLVDIPVQATGSKPPLRSKVSKLSSKIVDVPEDSTKKEKGT